MNSPTAHQKPLPVLPPPPYNTAEVSYPAPSVHPTEQETSNLATHLLATAPKPSAPLESAFIKRRYSVETNAYNLPSISDQRRGSAPSHPSLPVSNLVELVAQFNKPGSASRQLHLPLLESINAIVAQVYFIQDGKPQLHEEQLAKSRLDLIFLLKELRLSPTLSRIILSKLSLLLRLDPVTETSFHGLTDLLIRFTDMIAITDAQTYDIEQRRRLIGAYGQALLILHLACRRTGQVVDEDLRESLIASNQHLLSLLGSKVDDPGLIFVRDLASQAASKLQTDYSSIQRIGRKVAAVSRGILRTSNLFIQSTLHAMGMPVPLAASDPNAFKSISTDFKDGFAEVGLRTTDWFAPLLECHLMVRDLLDDPNSTAALDLFSLIFKWSAISNYEVDSSLILGAVDALFPLLVLSSSAEILLHTYRILLLIGLKYDYSVKQRIVKLLEKVFNEGSPSASALAHAFLNLLYETRTEWQNLLAKYTQTPTETKPRLLMGSYTKTLLVGSEQKILQQLVSIYLPTLLPQIHWPLATDTSWPLQLIYYAKEENGTNQSKETLRGLIRACHRILPQPFQEDTDQMAFSHDLVEQGNALLIQLFLEEAPHLLDLTRQSSSNITIIHRLLTQPEAIGLPLLNLLAKQNVALNSSYHQGNTFLHLLATTPSPYHKVILKELTWQSPLPLHQPNHQGHIPLYLFLTQYPNSDSTLLHLWVASTFAGDRCIDQGTLKTLRYYLEPALLQTRQPLETLPPPLLDILCPSILTLAAHHKNIDLVGRLLLTKPPTQREWFLDALPHLLHHQIYLQLLSTTYLQRPDFAKLWDTLVPQLKPEGNQQWLVGGATKLTCEELVHKIHDPDDPLYSSIIGFRPWLQTLHQDTSEELVERIFQETMDQRDQLGCSLLHHSLLNNHPISSDLILSKLDPTTLQDLKGNTPLHYAAAHFNVSIYHELLQKVSNPFIVNNNGAWPLSLALYGHASLQGAYTEELENAFNDMLIATHEWLIAHQSDYMEVLTFQDRNQTLRWSLLHDAVLWGRADQIKLICQYFPKLLTTDGKLTPLLLGYQYRKTEAVEALLEAAVELHGSGPIQLDLFLTLLPEPNGPVVQPSVLDIMINLKMESLVSMVLEQRWIDHQDGLPTTTRHRLLKGIVLQNQGALLNLFLTSEFAFEVVQWRDRHSGATLLLTSLIRGHYECAEAILSFACTYHRAELQPAINDFLNAMPSLSLLQALIYRSKETSQDRIFSILNKLFTLNYVWDQPFHILARYNDSNLCEIFLTVARSHVAPATLTQWLYAKNEYQQSALLIAAFHESTGILAQLRQALLAYPSQQDTELLTTDAMGLTPLHAAAQWGRKEELPMLLEKGYQLQSPDLWGNTPLHYAAAFHQTSFMQAALATMKTKDAKTAKLVGISANIFGLSPLHRTLESFYMPKITTPKIASPQPQSLVGRTFGAKKLETTHPLLMTMAELIKEGLTMGQPDGIKKASSWDYLCRIPNVSFLKAALDANWLKINELKGDRDHHTIFHTSASYGHLDHLELLYKVKDVRTLAQQQATYFSDLAYNMALTPLGTAIVTRQWACAHFLVEQANQIQENSLRHEKSSLKDNLLHLIARSPATLDEEVASLFEKILIKKPSLARMPGKDENSVEALLKVRKKESLKDHDQIERLLQLIASYNQHGSHKSKNRK